MENTIINTFTTVTINQYSTNYNLAVLKITETSGKSITVLFINLQDKQNENKLFTSKNL